MTTTSTAEVQPVQIGDTRSQLGNLLEEYGEIAAILPVLTGLLVTTQLRLRGGQCPGGEYCDRSGDPTGDCAAQKTGRSCLDHPGSCRC